MTAKRMRVFAGPNGSGKTTIFKGILEAANVNLGVYVNADEIEASLKKDKQLDFAAFGINVDTKTVHDFFRESKFSPFKRKESDLYRKISIVNNILTTTASIDAYLAADLAELIRQQLLANAVSFTYETVMSHPSKIQFLHEAQQKGYRVYLYFVATEDPEINKNRVRVRVEQDGHNVDPSVIESRYYKSLGNLKAAVKETNRAYIFDNSKSRANLIAEITNGTDVVLNTAFETPHWVAEYLTK